MNHHLRLAMFCVGAVIMAILLGSAVAGLPRIAHSPTGQAINHTVVPLRHINDAVSAVNFDYRGFDTLGEEFILFASVMGAAALLREPHPRGRRRLRDAAEAGRDFPVSPAVHVWTLATIAPEVLLGLYIVTHGQVSPGGGFQGGVVLATAPLLVYLAPGYDAFKRIVPHTLLEPAESAGAGAYGIIGLVSLFFAAPYLANVLPLGTKGDLFSGGTVPLISLFTGVEVTGGFVLLLYTFLTETLTRPRKHRRPQAQGGS